MVPALLLAASIAAGCNRRAPPAPQPAEQRPTLLLLTSLPLVFGEKFSLADNGSEALSRLESRYRVRPISVADAGNLRGAKLLLAAHPSAQPAENLVALDQWVREGGRVLLLADPMLEWHSERPLGDPLRPPPAFADTGLLAHWGLRLDAPDRRGPVFLGGGHNPVGYLSPGRLVSTNDDCELSRADIVADCKIGKGHVTVVADADFLNTDWLERPAPDNLNALLADLTALEEK